MIETNKDLQLSASNDRRIVEKGSIRYNSYGMGKSGRKLHLVKTLAGTYAYSWCGYFLPVWFSEAKEFRVSQPFQYCQHCIDLLNESIEPSFAEVSSS